MFPTCILKSLAEGSNHRATSRSRGPPRRLLMKMKKRYFSLLVTISFTAPLALAQSSVAAGAKAAQTMAAAADRSNAAINAHNAATVSSRAATASAANSSAQPATPSPRQPQPVHPSPRRKARSMQVSLIQVRNQDIAPFATLRMV
jgi:hypothetical protein